MPASIYSHFLTARVVALLIWDRFAAAVGLAAFVVAAPYLVRGFCRALISVDDLYWTVREYLTYAGIAAHQLHPGSWT